MSYVEYEDQTNSTLFSSCSTEIIPLISDHRQIEVLRYITDIHNYPTFTRFTHIYISLTKSTYIQNVPNV